MATYPTADLDVATRIDCRWRDNILLNTTATPQSGAAIIFVRSSSNTDSDAVRATPTSGLCDRTMNAHAIVPLALSDAATPCNASAPSPWCRWGDSRQLTLGTRAWTTGVNYTQIRVAPLMKLPVGGLWRLTMWAARLSEPPGDPKSPGTPVNRHIVTFDANFHQARGWQPPPLLGLAALRHGALRRSVGPPPSTLQRPPLLSLAPPARLLQNNVGSVWRNETGPLINQQMMINLTSALPAACTGTNCWHRLVVQGKAFDPVSQGVQTGSMVTAFEAVPPCPPTQAPFMTSVMQVREAGWWGVWLAG